MRNDLIDLLVWVDIKVFLCITLGRAKPGETMSAAAWHAHITGKFFGFSYLLIDLLAYPVQRDHCQTVWTDHQEQYQ